MENPIRHNNLPASFIQDINHRHIKNVDKLYRMFAGLSSELLEYSDQTLQIAIECSEKWKKPVEDTALQIAESWKTSNPELQHAKYYQAIILTPEKMVKINGKLKN
jgi:hypothetical protein